MTDTNDAEIARLRAALLSIVTDGDAMNGEECQQIAAEALQIPVPPPPVIPRRRTAPPDLPAPYAHNAPSQSDIEKDGAYPPPDMSRGLWR